MAINLIPEANYLLVAQRRRNIIFVITGLIVLVLLAVWGVLYWLQYQAGTSLAQAKEKLTAIETEIQNQKTVVQRIVLFDKRLTAYDHLLKQHVSWDPFLGEIERLLPPSTVLSRLFVQVDEGKADITGSTPVIDTLAQTLASLENRGGQQKTIFTSARFKDVQQEVVPDGASTYTFSASLEFDPALLNTFQ